MTHYWDHSKVGAHISDVGIALTVALTTKPCRKDNHTIFGSSLADACALALN